MERRVVLKSISDENLLGPIVHSKAKASLSETTQKKRKLSTTSPQKKQRMLTSFKVFQDASNCDPRTGRQSISKKSYVEQGTNTEETVVQVESRVTADDLTSDEPGIDYWKLLAETRREALEKALEENERLHTEVTNLKTEIEETKTEMKKYEELAEKAEYLADTLKFLTENAEQSEQEDEEDDKSPTDTDQESGKSNSSTPNDTE